MDAKTARTANIRALVAEAGGPTRFAELLASERWPQAQVSQWISDKNPKPIGHKLARALELRLGKPTGWLDAPQFGGSEFVSSPVATNETRDGYVRFQLLDGVGGMGQGAVNHDYPEVIREVDMAEWEVRRKLGFIPAPGRIRLITGRGPSMRPMIENGDVVMVDTSIAHFDGDAVYVINVSGETQIKMLQMRGDGLYVVSANQDYPPYRVEPENMHIGGKVAAVLGMREM